MSVQFDAALAELEERLGYRFRDPDLLRVALTHPSYANEVGEADNQRLEFLGDAVLQLTVSRYLYCAYPDTSESELSKYRENLVSNKALLGPARRLSLGSYLFLGRGEEKQGGRTREKNLADAMEAVAGAIFLDAGQTVEGVVSDTLLGILREELSSPEILCAVDYKTRLQQLVEQGGIERLTYRLVSNEPGEGNTRIFTVEACLNSNVIGVGRGFSQQEAEEEAAQKALLLFGQSNA